MNILKLSHNEARMFFLKAESYCSFDLPRYFVFDDILRAVDSNIKQKGELTYSTYTNNKGKSKKYYPSEFEDVNYKFLGNKDGKFAWRPYQLIHPCLYVSLVNNLTKQEYWDSIIDRFGQFQNNPNIRCSSIPLQSVNEQSDKAILISQWWQEVEQQSLELALKYEYILHTDISDCYGSIYTHSIPWAIHTKQLAKQEKNNFDLVGNIIDKHLRDMAYGQTNGIPQGSVLMDFIAEIVLGYADLELSDKIEQENIQGYEIIRYRDDYRIFSNNPQTLEHIAKLMTEILIELGMRLNTQKTIISNNVIKSSLKPDKLYWISSRKKEKNIQNYLLVIHKLSEEYPNSGSLVKALSKFYNRIKDVKKPKQNIPVLISILADIMYKNPRAYPIITAILSKLLSLISCDNKRDEVLNLVEQKFNKIPNTGHLQVWLQRLTIKLDKGKQYSEKLCGKVNNEALQIWNSDWLENNLKNIVEKTPIIDQTVISNIDSIIVEEEVELFKVIYDS